MIALTVLESQTVGMGRILMGRGPTKLSAVLGSCVGVAVHDPTLGISVLGHVILPHAFKRDRENEQSEPGRYADTTIPYIIRLLREQGAAPENLVAKITGGASMFGEINTLTIGASNIDAVQCLLRQARVPIVAEHLGGNRGRHVTLECGSGDLAIEYLDLSPVVI